MSTFYWKYKHSNKNTPTPSLFTVYNAENHPMNHWIMLRIFIFIAFLMWSSFGQAFHPAPRYQVDIIVFTHLQTPLSTEQTLAPLITPSATNAIPLQPNQSATSTPYHILPASASQLRNEYWALNRTPAYQVLFHYTWLQPSKNEKPIALSQLNTGGWNIEGTLRVRQSNYYLLDTDLLFSAPQSTQTAFIFSKKQRLKPNQNSCDFLAHYDD